MNVLEALGAPAGPSRPMVLAAGSFDGVHLGHQRIIGEAIDRAAALGGSAWVLTFDPHPLSILRPEGAPPILTPMPERLRLIEGLGPDGCFVLPFTRAFSRQEPASFIESLRKNLPSLAALVVGDNWHFGRDARGDARLLHALGARHGFEAHIVDPVCWKGQPVSSTRVRRVIAEAHFDDVKGMLGRPYTVSGEIVHGHKVGRRLGYPTANIVPLTEVLPPHGIFAVWARVGREVLPGAAYYGHRPTFPDTADSFSLEVNILDFDADLYGHRVDVVFEKMIRPDCDFPSEEELKVQIQRDLASVREILSTRSPPPREPVRSDGKILG